MQTPVWNKIADRALELGPDAEPLHRTADWRLTQDGDGVAWLLLDRQDESVNTISAGVLEQLDDMLDRLESSPPFGLALRSAKSNGFAAGADIRAFRDVESAEAVAEQITRAHRVIDRLAGLAIPTVAVVHGFCFGGDLELALTCDRRIAVHGARLGFPEVMLGLHPGAGGIFRLTELIDPTEAMKLMLTGKPVAGRKAKSLGIVDDVVEERHVAAAVGTAVAGKLKSQRRGWKASALDTGPGRRMAARQMRSETQKRVSKEHYPAPYALIDLWEAHGGDPKAMQSAEIASFSDLMVGDTARNLIRVFFLRERLKGLGKDVERPISQVHVVGAGTMGGDIAAWCALQGLRTTLTDLDPEMIAKAIGRASALFDDKLPESRHRRDARDRLIPDFAGDGAATADLVIEAIAEKTEAKRKLYDRVEPRMKPEAVLATNTSSLPLEILRENLARPERFVGLHFFNPVAKMQLVEVVAHDGADAAALEAARAFCTRIDRLPGPVADSPGFLVNRVLTPYLMEAMLLLDEGTSPEAIDRAAERFGMAMGPVEVADRVGLDICLTVLDALRERLGGSMPDAPAWLRQKVDKGELGRKTGHGFYKWKNDKPEKRKEDTEPDAAMIDRLVLPIVNTSAACLRERVVKDADLLDAAMIFATGFAPFRGGPMKYARDRGIGPVRDRLKELAQSHGDRFAPDTGLAEADKSV